MCFYTGQLFPAWMNSPLLAVLPQGWRLSYTLQGTLAFHGKCTRKPPAWSVCTCAKGWELGTQLEHNPGMVSQGKGMPRQALPCSSELALQSQAGGLGVRASQSVEMSHHPRFHIAYQVRACHVWDQTADMSQMPLQHRGLGEGRGEHFPSKAPSSG